MIIHQQTYNCRKSKKPNCPLRDNCLISNIVYKVKQKVQKDQKQKDQNRIYIGSIGGSFKDRYVGHKHTIFINID